MRRRWLNTFRPDMEFLEAKRMLSAGASSSAASHAVAKLEANADVSGTAGHSLATPKPSYGYLVYHISEPKLPVILKPPFQQVLVQTRQPIPGQTYNMLQVAVQNGSARTFHSSDHLTVKLSGQTKTTPILSGSENWKPQQFIVFYVLTKKYYPIQNTNAGGFVFNLDGAYSKAIPGPSGIFLRITYDPATFAKSLDYIVAYGQGSQNGHGVATGVADTAIYSFVSSKTNRIDFGGYY